jgi:tetratricopeptide (TPR) repeat protein
MGREADQEPALAVPKVEPFGDALRSAIKREFRFAKELAKAMGVTEGWVSQLVNGKEHASPQTLEDILSCFKTLAIRESLHAAWVADVARFEIDDGRTWNVIELQQEIELLVEAGQINRALQTVNLQRSSTTDPVMWQNMTERVAQLSLRLGRTAPAYLAIEEMRKEAMVRSDRMDLLTALWMKGTVLRLIDTSSVQVLMGAHKDAADYAQSWMPDEAKGKALWMNRRTSLLRDFALNVLALHDRRKLGGDALHKALEAAEKAISSSQSDHELCLALEVRGRIQAELGDVFNADETLEELLERGTANAPELDVKSLLTQARIHEQRKEKDAAIDALTRASEWCVENSDVHHLRVADQRLMGLLQCL